MMLSVSEAHFAGEVLSIKGAVLVCFWGPDCTP